MENKDKSAGKFAWFCLGSILAFKGIPKFMHFIYLGIIAVLLFLNLSLLPQLAEDYRKDLEKANNLLNDCDKYDVYLIEGETYLMTNDYICKRVKE